MRPHSLEFPQPPQTVLPTWDHVFKYLNLLGAFHIQSIANNHCNSNNDWLAVTKILCQALFQGFYVLAFYYCNRYLRQPTFEEIGYLGSVLQGSDDGSLVLFRACDEAADHGRRKICIPQCPGRKGGSGWGSCISFLVPLHFGLYFQEVSLFSSSVMNWGPVLGPWIGADQAHTIQFP